MADAADLWRHHERVAVTGIHRRRENPQALCGVVVPPFLLDTDTLARCFQGEGKRSPRCVWVSATRRCVSGCDELLTRKEKTLLRALAHQACLATEAARAEEKGHTARAGSVRAKIEAFGALLQRQYGVDLPKADPTVYQNALATVVTAAVGVTSVVEDLAPHTVVRVPHEPFRVSQRCGRRWKAQERFNPVRAALAQADHLGISQTVAVDLNPLSDRCQDTDVLQVGRLGTAEVKRQLERRDPNLVLIRFAPGQEAQALGTWILENRWRTVWLAASDADLVNLVGNVIDRWCLSLIGSEEPRK